MQLRLRSAAASGWIIFILAFLACLAARGVHVSLFGFDMPLWDQWDGEGNHLLRPFFAGVLTWRDLYFAHNEHHIVFTKLITLALTDANDGQWDNLVEAYASAPLFAATFAVVVWGVTRKASAGAKASLVVTAAILAVLPFAYENALVGFQSQFYLMSLSAVVMIAVMTFNRPNAAALLGLVTIGVLSLFTMASGLLGAVAVIVVLGLQSWRSGELSRQAVAFAVAMLIVIGIGTAILPSVEAHARYVARGPFDFTSALATALMWPFQPNTPAAWPLGTRLLLATCIWSPSAIWLVRFAYRRKAYDNELFAAAVVAWSLAQAVAYAHSRGHGVEFGIQSRYQDLMAIAMLANIFLAIRLAQLVSLPPRRKVLANACTVLYVCLLADGLARRTPSDAANERNHFVFTSIQTANVAAYVRSGDVTYLNQPFFQIPYPDADHLQALLNDPGLRAALAPSIRPQVPTILWTTPDARFSRLQLTLVRNGVAGASDKLSLVGRTNGVPKIIDLAPLQGEAIGHVYVELPGGDYKLIFKHASTMSDSSLASFVYIGPLSMAAQRLQDSVRAWDVALNKD